ncbi:3-deoxy-D-manno-octulosonate 8-phosphate phosphatase (KDO 8-P phosphatase) [Noviherbaspirillum humi]|uniref:3-deoxy-D-manno-octulosonate 8-phosphate phosphatase KdsC n=1 Tax=Noviherbaspirillum humi TaxID=1688639 RepID=A0A239JGG4_9BURK|nr:HAD family hydrolase [Noviherbaspirillum humi]SNT04383.1 3-deoxy-D-manno-octulosonate 8-phosphate phosphatase (KDO 8-P phosphatase) [Noviherbaspirillum humi]
MDASVMDRARRVRLMVFDVDGVLTDGGLHYGPEGEVLKRFNVLDGHGIKLLQQSGVDTAIISARKSAIVERRAADLGIRHVRQGVHDKRTAFAELLRETGLSAEQCGFIGDDVIDLPILLQVGFAASVPNGHEAVTSRVHYVTRSGGGQGAARELCDLILRAQGNYEAALAPYLT